MFKEENIHEKDVNNDNMPPIEIFRTIKREPGQETCFINFQLQSEQCEKVKPTDIVETENDLNVKKEVEDVKIIKTEILHEECELPSIKTEDELPSCSDVKPKNSNESIGKEENGKKRKNFCLVNRKGLLIMPKRKSNLSFHTREARRKRLSRINESQQEREHRLADQRMRQYTHRLNESSFEKVKRLQLEKTRRLLSRRQESVESRNRRLEADRIRHAVWRSQESADSRAQRMEADRIRHVVSRSQESDKSRNGRKEGDRIQHAVSRSQEPDESRNRRLEDDRIRHAVSRSRESDESRNRRLENDRIRQAISRSQKSDKSRAQLTAADRICHQNQHIAEMLDRIDSLTQHC